MARECNSLDEALAVPGVVHIESGAKIIAYTSADALPNYCKVSPSQAGKEITLEDIDARLKTLEGK